MTKEQIVEILTRRYNVYEAAEEIFALESKDEPKLVTDDGASVAIGAYYWYVNREFNIIRNRVNLAHIDFNSSNVLARFSTEELAQNFVIENKPCLSWNDVVEFVRNECGEKCFEPTEDGENLKNLAKSKI
jgi:hypothetical protein